MEQEALDGTEGFDETLSPDRTGTPYEPGADWLMFKECLARLTGTGNHRMLLLRLDGL